MAVVGILCSVSLVLVDVIAILSAVLEVAALLTLGPKVAAVLWVDRLLIGGGWVVFFCLHLGMVIYTA